MRKLLASLLFFLTLAAAHAQCVTGSLPFNLTNGTTADASQVMANYNYIVNQVNANCATAGANSSITALTGLTTPLTAGQGGSQIYTAGTSTGSANAQVVSSGIVPAGFSTSNHNIACFTAGFTNTSTMTLNYNSVGGVNVFKRTVSSSPTALTGGEVISGGYYCVQWDGTQYELLDYPIVPGTLSGTSTVTTSTNLAVSSAGSHVILSGSSNIVLTLPTSVNMGNGQVPYFIITNSGSGTNSLSTPVGLFAGSGASGTTSQSLAPGTMYLVASDGNDYWVQSLRKLITPTSQKLTSGSSATYTAPSNLVYIKVRMLGGGGGGGGANANGGGTGGATSFGSWTANAGTGGTNGGSNAIGSPAGSGGSGGTNGTGSVIDRVSGGGGGIGATGGGGTPAWGGMGCTSREGSGGSPVSNGAGGSPVANTGAGGAGGGTSSGGNPAAGAGGGCGEYVEFTMTSAQVGATQTYTIGAGGSGGSAGGQAGGAGAAGVIVVEEFYN